MAQFNSCIDFDLQIGESPVWDAERQALWFVDILKPSIYLYDPKSGSVRSYKMPDLVASLGLASDGRLILAQSTDVCIFDPENEQFEFLATPEFNEPKNRLNDGKVGPDGCFWVGSMHDSYPRLPTGALYRINAQGQVSKELENIKVSNGLAWSPSGKILYHSDSSAGEIWQYTFDPIGGVISGGHLFARTTSESGLPDGAAIDAEGNYWSAGVTAGVINKFSENGSLVDVIPVPFYAPTMICFGGRDLKTVYVTSLSTQKNGHKQSGGVISLRSDVPGVAVSRFQY